MVNDFIADEVGETRHRHDQGLLPAVRPRSLFDFDHGKTEQVVLDQWRWIAKPRRRRGPNALMQNMRFMAPRRTATACAMGSESSLASSAIVSALDLLENDVGVNKG